MGERLDTMLLAVAATEFELGSFKSRLLKHDDQVMTAVCGVGPVESAVRFMQVLGDHEGRIKCVVNFGIGGAYLGETVGPAIGLLDICLAESEILGDYGVCYGNQVEPFSRPDLTGKTKFMLSEALLNYARTELAERQLDVFTGAFVTVNGASGTAARGRFMKSRFNSICENMEGAAIARCCDMFSLPMVEVRVISNMVDDRPGAPWKLKEACSHSGYVASLIVEKLKEIV